MALTGVAYGGWKPLSGEVSSFGLIWSVGRKAELAANRKRSFFAA